MTTAFLVEQGIDSISFNPGDSIENDAGDFEEKNVAKTSTDKKDKRPIICGTDSSAAAGEVRARARGNRALLRNAGASWLRLIFGN